MLDCSTEFGMPNKYLEKIIVKRFAKKWILFAEKCEQNYHIILTKQVRRAHSTRLEMSRARAVEHCNLFRKKLRDRDQNFWRFNIILAKKIHFCNTNEFGTKRNHMTFGQKNLLLFLNNIKGI
jgi:hypothetical protein